MNTDALNNFTELINRLSSSKWYGELVVKMEAGEIVIGEVKSKIKFDNGNYLKYKNNRSNI